MRGSNRRQSEHAHRRRRLRQPQAPSHGRTSLSVSDRSENVSRLDPPRDVRRRVLHPGLAGAGARHFASRRVGQPHATTSRPRTRYSSGDTSSNKAVEKYRSTRAGRMVPPLPGAKVGGKPPRGSEVRPPDGPTPKPRPTELARRSHCLRLSPGGTSCSPEVLTSTPERVGRPAGSPCRGFDRCGCRNCTRLARRADNYWLADAPSWHLIHESPGIGRKCARQHGGGPK